VKVEKAVAEKVVRGWQQELLSQEELLE